VYAGVFNNLSPAVPRNAGSLSRIDVVMREGAVVGVPRPGVGTSVATTNICDRLLNAVQLAFACAGSPYGSGEGSTGGPPSFSVVSGHDPRRDNEFFINQTVIGFGGGPAVYGHDGWLTYNKPVAGGMLRADSVEMNELAYPILYSCIELAIDSGGPGTWRGAPGIRTVFGPRLADITLAYYSDSRENPPRGVLGGGVGAPSGANRVTADGVSAVLPIAGTVVLSVGEHIESIWAGGGGYGPPLLRDADAVCRDVEDEIVSPRVAEAVYGVVIEWLQAGAARVHAETPDRTRMRLAALSACVESSGRSRSGC
jgi:N-methylhydantoinase B